jgi:hypothetical protein
MLGYAPLSTVAVSEALALGNSALLAVTLDGVSISIEGSVVRPKAATVTPAGAPGRWWAIDGKAFYGTRAEAEAVASQKTEAPQPAVKGKKQAPKPRIKPAPLSLVLEQMEALALPTFDISLYQGPAAVDVAKFLAELELQTAQMQQLRAEIDDEDVLLLSL